MQRTLIIIRHAKSSWANASQQDFDRPLNERGEHDAPLIAARLKKASLHPDAIITSAAKRTRQTAKRIAKGTEFPAEKIILKEELYHCMTATFETVIEAVKEEVQTLFIIAHNPGITEFANSFSEKFRIDNMPTCAAVGVKMNLESWADFKSAAKKVFLFEYPKKFMIIDAPTEIIASLRTLFEEHFKDVPNSVEKLDASGSDRIYYRLKNEKHTAIGTWNSNVSENNSYFYFAGLFQKHGVQVPEVFAVGKDRKSYLQQNLGSTSLFDLLLKDGYTDEVFQQFQKAINELAKAQWIAGRETDFNQCFAIKHFDEKAVLADLLYFKYYFADLQKVHYDRLLLMDELESLSRELGRIQPQTLMYRDFQSRNIMLHEGKTYLIDFQGAMQGPPQYDLASLLWQARAQLPQQWKDKLLNSYIATLGDLSIARMDEVHFRKGYAQFVLLRMMQVLGAYGFRGLIEKKPHFVSSIAPGLKNLEIFLGDNPGTPAYPELRSLLEKLASPAFREKFEMPKPAEKSNLNIAIQSFSYKKGIPKDETEHGGGYVFDCRGILNPGRFAPFKHLSGLDPEVQQFLKTETHMPEFLEHIFKLVSLNVDDYLARGFEHLSVSFGCTGGQHRSVFAAEQLAIFLQERYKISASKIHVNQQNWRKWKDEETGGFKG